MPGDLYWNEVELLLEMEGVNNGTTFTDLSSTRKTLTRRGATGSLPVTSTFIAKVGSASGLLSGNTQGSYMNALTCTLLNPVGSGAFTIETWVYMGNSSYINSQPCLFANRYASNFSFVSLATTNFWLYLDFLGDDKIKFASSNFTLASTTSMTTSTWVHVAVTRDADKLVRLFINGTKEAEGTCANNFSNQYAGIGQYALSNYSTGNSFSMWVDHFRLTNVCRYTEDFLPSLEAYPLEYGTPWGISGTVYERNEFGVDVPGAYPVRVYRRSDGALVGSTTSAGDGTYEILNLGPIECYVVALDNTDPPSGGGDCR